MNDFSEKAIFLTMEEEQQALELWQMHNDPQALQLILRSYYPFILAKARKFFNYTQQREDLISAGIEGFLVAIRRFESGFKARLGTYSAFWIDLFMKEFIIHSQSITSISSLKRKFFFKWMHLQSASHEDSFHNIEACAMELGISLQQAKELYLEFSQSFSLDQFEERSFEGAFCGEQEDALIESADWNRYQTLFAKAFESCLTQKEKEILNYRLYREEVTLKELAEKCNLSTERIRQIEKKGIEKIKKRIAMMQIRKSDSDLKNFANSMAWESNQTE